MASRPRRRPVLISSLKRLGFDQSYRATRGGPVTVKCSQCEALVINGVPAHEQRCPNIPVEKDDR